MVLFGYIEIFTISCKVARRQHYHILLTAVGQAFKKCIQYYRKTAFYFDISVHVKIQINVEKHRVFEDGSHS
jgi:hypothetical protein